MSRDKVTADGRGTSSTGLWNAHGGACTGPFFMVCTTVTICVSIRVTVAEVASLATMITVRGVHLANAADVDVNDRRLCPLANLLLPPYNLTNT